MSKRTSLFVKIFSLNFLLLLLSILLFQTCSDDNSPTEPNDNNNPTSDVISIGEVTQEISKIIGTDGGKVVVTNSDSPINGLTITVPQKGYDETRNYTVSYAPITSHDLGENFNPISPMITIKNGGGYSDMPISIEVPIKKESDEFVIGFVYDEVTGKIEALPVIMSDDNSITVETRHFATSTISGGLQLNKKLDESSFANIVISSIKESALSGQSVISSGFTPGIDDWEFINYGSYISPGGHCAGQSMTAMWYFYEKKLKGEASLFHRFDEVNNSDKPGVLWQDNPQGYRFASTIQEDFNWAGWVRNVNIQSYIPTVTWKTFIAAMLLTGEPQSVIIKESATDAGHAMIVYKISVTEGKLYIADPNYPNNRGTDGTESIRTINYSNGKFDPYPSFLKAGDEGTLFDQIAFFGKTANIDWTQIEKRYAEIQTEIIGNDRFPKYDLFMKSDNSDIGFFDGIVVDTNKLDLFSQSSDCEYIITGTDNYQVLRAYDEITGNRIATVDANGILSLLLKPGENTIGLEICGGKQYGEKVSLFRYVDFKWFTVYYQTLSIEPNPLTGKPEEENMFTALSEGSAPKGNAKYVWSFDDNTNKITSLNDSTITHTFADTGTYMVSVELFENSTGNKIDEATLSFTVEGDVPTITSITPSTSSVGEVVQIKGNNFGVNQNSNEIWFGTVKALASDIVSWVNTQIEVKVPEGAITGDVHIVAGGEKSNDVSFTVGGEPIITDIIDHLYNRDFQGMHRFTLPNNTADIVGQNFGDYPSIRKVYVNNIEADIYNWSDTLVQFKLPEEPTGNISVKLVASTGTSNEFPYFSGFPLSYLTTTNSLKYGLRILVDFTHIGIGGEGRNDWYVVGCMSDPTYSGEVATKEAFSWSNNTLIIDISKQEPTLSGTLKFTFSLDGLNIEKLELDYINSEKGLEEVHFVAKDIPYRTSYNGDYFTQDLLGVTTSLTGEISSFLSGEEVGRTNIMGINTIAGNSTIYLELSF